MVTKMVTIKITMKKNIGTAFKENIFIFILFFGNDLLLTFAYTLVSLKAIFKCEKNMVNVTHE